MLANMTNLLKFNQFNFIYYYQLLIRDHKAYRLISKTGS
jgi:hypothetical protein